MGTSARREPGWLVCGRGASVAAKVALRLAVGLGGGWAAGNGDSLVNVEISLGAADEARIIRNLWPLYQHDVSAFDGAVPNRHGIFGSDDTTTLAQHAASLDAWWGDPAALYPYLIAVDGAPAGFDLIAARPRLPRGIEADFVVHEFFVLHAYRGSGAAERAAMLGFDRHRGRWEVVTYPTHAKGIAFWRRVIGDYTSMQFSEVEVDHPWGRRVAFHFDNAG